MSYLPELRSSLLEAAHRERGTAGHGRGVPLSAPPRRGRLRRWRTVLAAVVLCLAGAAAALAAVGAFQTGTPVGPEVRPSPSASEGVAISGSVKLLPLRVADPGGGPAWGLRVLRTTRGLTCVQLGRVVFGTVGVLGQDGAFGNDGRFHPLSEDYLEIPFACGITDARGNGFLNISLHALPASGLIGGPLSAGGCVPADESRSGQRVQRCPPGDMRDVYYGLLGPDAVSITHLTATGKAVTTPTTGSDGAYLIVLPHAAPPCASRNRSPGSCPVGEQGLAGGPDLGFGAISAVTYADGHTCHPPAVESIASPSASCHPVGFVSPPTRAITKAQLAAPISVREIPARSYCERLNTVEPCGTRTPRGFQRLSGGQRSLLVEISFTSRVTIPDSRSYYEFSLSYPHSRSCTVGGTFGPTNSDIRAGHRVLYQELAPYSCPGVVHGSIRYVSSAGPASSMFVPGGPGQGNSVPVGRFSFVVP